MVFIYVLKLKENKYYIGKTNSPNFRLNDHFNQNGGSSWTKKYKPIEIYEIIPNQSDYDEQRITQEYMNKYGIENVRGGSYCQLKLDHNSIETLSREISHANNKCLYCNKLGHFISACPNKMNITSKIWMKRNYLIF